MSFTELIGPSACLREIESEIRHAAQSDAKILLTGESGVGKEVVARLIHRRSNRAARPFVAMNCAGVPETLLESELFGHTRGSFTGAYRDKPGVFEQADHGTIFMDEVGEMSLRMQALLLRFLEDGVVQRVGADARSTKVSVRVIAATNRVLLDRVESGDFRKDLYYRLNVVHIVIPPLRDRRDDVMPLFNHFMQIYCGKYGVEPLQLAAGCASLLEAYDWPGNVRELKNVVERLVVSGRQSPVLPDHLPVDVRHIPMAKAPAQGRVESLPSQLFNRVVRGQESFWSAVYAPFIAHDLTREDVRAIVTMGLRQTRGNYKLLVSLFNLPAEDYKSFLAFLRKYQCQVAFQQFRTNDPAIIDERTRLVS